MSKPNITDLSSLKKKMVLIVSMLKQPKSEIMNHMDQSNIRKLHRLTDNN